MMPQRRVNGSKDMVIMVDLGELEMREEEKERWRNI